MSHFVLGLIAEMIPAVMVFCALAVGAGCGLVNGVVIAYGKLGGKELGYASDLDIIFLYDDADERAPAVYARLAVRLQSWVTTRTSAGC